MNEKEKKVLTNFRKVLYVSVEANDITPHLVKSGVIAMDDYELIRNEVRRSARMSNLLDICLRKLQKISDFTEALENAQYIDLANRIRNAQTPAEWGEQSLSEIAESLHISDRSLHISPVLSSPPPEAVQCLKDVYINNCEVMKQHWSKLLAEYPEEFEMDDMYIDLVIIKEGRRSNEIIHSYPELFGVKNGIRQYRKIILEGDPGMGKTTYLHRLVQNWAKNRDEWFNKEFQLIILVRLGDVEPSQTLRELLPLPTEAYKSAIWQFVMDPQNHNRTLIVLDAFDEMPEGCEYFNSLIEKQVLGDIQARNITLLISTRTSHSYGPALIKRDFLVRTMGFHPDIVQEKFAGKILNLDKLSADKVELFRSPLLAEMAASIRFIPGELFDLMETFSLKTVKRYLARSKGSPEHAPEMTKKVKSFLGKFAFLRLQQQIPFKVPNVKELLIRILQPEINDYGSVLLQICCDTGLLWPRRQWTASFATIQSAITTMENFPHRLFEEYFAANFVAEKLDLVTLDTGNILKADPFSYFLTAFSPIWREQVLEELGNQTLEWRWIYNAGELSDGKFAAHMSTVPANFNQYMFMKYKVFLETVAGQPELNPTVLIDPLLLDEIITLQDYEMVQHIKDSFKRKVALFRSVLVHKNSHKVVNALGKIAEEKQIDVLSKLISEHWGDTDINVEETSVVGETMTSGFFSTEDVPAVMKPKRYFWNSAQNSGNWKINRDTWVLQQLLPNLMNLEADSSVLLRSLRIPNEADKLGNRLKLYGALKANISHGSIVTLEKVCMKLTHSEDEFSCNLLPMIKTQMQRFSAGRNRPLLFSEFKETIREIYKETFYSLNEFPTEASKTCIKEQGKGTTYQNVAKYLTKMSDSYGVVKAEINQTNASLVSHFLHDLCLRWATDEDLSHFELILYANCSEVATEVKTIWELPMRWLDYPGSLEDFMFPLNKVSRKEILIIIDGYTANGPCRCKDLERLTKNVGSSYFVPILISTDCKLPNMSSKIMIEHEMSHSGELSLSGATQDSSTYADITLDK